MKFENSEAFAEKLDRQDSLNHFREKFYFPKHTDGSDILYFCGNSLGLQPKTAQDATEEVLEAWKTLAVEGHFEGSHPWISYHDELGVKMAKIVGAKPIEVVAMNTLTVNLNLMMVSFYRPNKNRYKILIEGGAFPSDQYAVKSQIEFHGYEVNDALIELHPRNGEDNLRTDDIIKTIKKHGDEIALIIMGGLNYYTGQVYDMKAISEVGHEVGAIVGFDLAHAAGNIPLNLHQWQVDFAVWCTYKYLNSGPGGVGGVFIHENNFKKDLPRFTGWWGYDRATRFLMKDTFEPMVGAQGWQMSNGSIFSMAGLKASLDIFELAGFDNLQIKARQLTAFLEFLIENLNLDDIEIVTPRNPKDRGSQLSIRVKNNDKSLFDKIRANGVIGDWREPDVIRIAPVPLYNSFMDVYRFVTILDKTMAKGN